MKIHYGDQRFSSIFRQQFIIIIQIIKMSSMIRPQGHSNRRLKGITKHVPIIVGSIALWQGKKADEQHTHKWSCYVRGLNNDEDISYYIKKVEFTLHPSFVEPIKTVEKFPFEIHQTGWGEFDIGVKIIFIDPAEKPVEMTHYLKLHPDQNPQQNSTKKPVVSERYDEIVFQEPTEYFAYILDKGASNAQKMLEGEEHKEIPHHIDPHDIGGDQPMDQTSEAPALNPTSLAQTSTTGVEDKNKPIDRRQFADYLFKLPQDQQDVEKLRECLEYMRYQVQKKREELIKMEREMTQQKSQVKNMDTENFQE